VIAVLVAQVTLIGCTQTSEGTRCRDGFEAAADGHCYPPPTPWPSPSIQDALDSLPPCESTEPDGAIDIAPGCADGACVGMSAIEMTDVLGSEPSCQVASWSETKQYCLWEMGIEGLFDDLDEDGVPDEDAITERIHLVPPYPGQTALGSGIAVQVSCYLEDLGLPDEVVYEDFGGALHLTDLIYDRYGVKAYDWGSDTDNDSPDGRIDNLYLYGHP